MEGGVYPDTSIKPHLKPENITIWCSSLLLLLDISFYDSFISLMNKYLMSVNYMCGTESVSVEMYLQQDLVPIFIGLLLIVRRIRK